MAKQLSINIGFITNSSSVVHFFPKALLSYPKIAAFIKSFEIENGFVGHDMWHRGECASIAVTAEQKRMIQKDFDSEEDFRQPGIDTENEDEIIIVFGDEYNTIASQLSLMIDEIAKETGVDTSKSDYN